MLNYKELYEHYEGTPNHESILEVDLAESTLSSLLANIADPELRDIIDRAVGTLARAYEMQGFKMGGSVV